MKTMVGRFFLCVAALLLMAGIVSFTSCNAIQIGGELILRGDGSGSRKLILYLFDSENTDAQGKADGYGNAYKYCKLHGDALKAKIEEKLKANLGDSSWLTVSIRTGTASNVNGVVKPLEYITLAYNFTSFEDYVDKTTRLARFGGSRLPEGSKYTPPVLQTVRGDTARYRESANSTLWVVRPLFLAMCDDPNVMDVTGGGTNTKNELKDLKEFGLEMKTQEFQITLGSNKTKSILSGTDINEMFSRK
jgi:hypothetical protein